MTLSEINYNAGAFHREKIQQEINAYPIRIDRSCFQKTDGERKELKKAKALHKISVSPALKQRQGFCGKK